MTTNVFISWSGNLSHNLANLLRNYLPTVLPFIKPYFTSQDIESGSMWSVDIAKELEKSQIGLICLTKENLEKPWIMFEAGALSKIAKDSRVCTLLFDIDSSELKGPLTRFQATCFTKADFRKLIRTINRFGGANKLNETSLDITFDKSWCKFQSKVIKLFKSYARGKDDSRLSVCWPTRIWSFEAVIGGYIRQFDPIQEKLAIYVCAETETVPQCFLQCHPEKPTVKDGIWEAFARFGNEWAEVLHGTSPVEFYVLAAVLPNSESAKLPEFYRGTAGNLNDMLLKIFPKITVSKPMKIGRILKEKSNWVIQAIKKKGEVLIKIPPPREACYSISPPITLIWSCKLKDIGIKNPYMEIWHDSKRVIAPIIASFYKISSWPKNVGRIEVKISAFNGNGPYDSIYLVHTNNGQSK